MALDPTSPLTVLILAGAGLGSGFINTVGGGGSLLTVPLLMLLGMPAERANATNRVCVLGQSVAGAVDFQRAGRMDNSQLLPIVLIATLGAGAGALTAVWLPPRLFHWIVIGLLGAMALMLLVNRSFLRPTANHAVARRMSESPRHTLALFATGFYGGFLQAGVGLLLLWVLVDGLYYDITGANAIKTVVTGVYTLVALGIFIVYDLVDWLPGLYLTLGTIVGAKLAVRFSLRVRQDVLRTVVLATVLLTLAAAALK